MFRVALANLRVPASPAESVALACQAVAEASVGRADLICFPECFVPGYRGAGSHVPPPDAAFLERAWSAVAVAAAKAKVVVVLGTERVDQGRLYATAFVINAEREQSRDSKTKSNSIPPRRALIHTVRAGRFSASVR